MNTPRKEQFGQEMPTADATAPKSSEEGAYKMETSLTAAGSPAESSPTKNRFMTLLLDKLKVRGNDVGKGVQDERTAKQFGTGAAGFASTDRDTPSRVDVLQETHVLDSSSPAPRPMTFTYPPGAQPLSPYTIRRGIGLGGFGEVYFAVSQAGKEVALKRIQRNLEVEIRGVSHCLNLKHPNLVSLYDICQDDNGQSWVVMEYVAGANLREVLDGSPDGLPEEEARRWIAGIAAGVNHLHSAGLVHRDLKPGNIFDDLGMVKVGDYGLSKFISASHRGGHTESVGTFHYMAPEIGRGQYGREIDIYALGVILYELLTGRVPFDGESCHEIIVKHLTATAELSEIRQPYRSVISKCLAKDPAQRYSNVTEMLAALGLGEGGSVEPSEQIMTAEVVDVEEPLKAVVVENVSPKAPANSPSPSAARPATPEEPVARAVKQSLSDLNRWWATLDRSPGAKIFLLVIGVFVLVINTSWLLPLLSCIAVFYVPYYIARQMILHVRQQPTYAEAQRIAAVAGAPARPITRRQWRSTMRNDLRAKRSLLRMAELNTSWIAATFTAAGLAAAAAVVGLRNGPLDAMSIAPYGWMAVVVLVASLGILALGKLWEREDGESLPRRFVLAGVGAGIGAAAYTLNEFLMLPMGEGLARDVDATKLPQALYQDGVPVASGMMAHFALLFSMLRWWKPVDPLRRTRLSLWAVAVAVVAEWVVHQFIPIPQPAGMLIAGGTAIVVQLSAPWINPRVPRRPAVKAPVASQVV
ncbi:MAG: serine/threonine-protein kinase [Planctomycetota bacterium]